MTDRPEASVLYVNADSVLKFSSFVKTARRQPEIRIRSVSHFENRLTRKSGQHRTSENTHDLRHHSRKQWAPTRSDFGDSPVRVEVYASEETVEIFVEADSETLPEERRRFALINVPRDQFSHATGEAARRATRKDRYRRATSA